MLGTAAYQFLPCEDGNMPMAVLYRKDRKTGEVRRKYQADSAKANAGIGDVLFWLVRSVTHKPMPGALPSDSVLGDAARDAALDALDALLATKGDAA